jgi:hypothetical protein
MKSFLRLLGSVVFTVMISILLIVLLVISTSIESSHGSALSQALFYNTWWFDLVLALIWVNIFCSMVVRWPFRWQHVGFLLTHIGILGILSGAFVMKHFSFDGQLMVAEGETVNYVQRAGKPSAKQGKKPAFCPLAVKDTSKLPVPVLKVTDKKGHEILSYSISADGIPEKINLPGTVFEIRKLAFYPYASVQGKGVLVDHPDGRSPNPAVSFDLVDRKGHAVRQFVFAFFPDLGAMHASAGKDGTDLGFRLEAGKLEDYLVSTDTPKGPDGLAPTDPADELPFSITLKQFRRIDYPGTMDAAAFESEVVLHDKKNGVTLEKVISMNHPLTYNGYKIFQMSYIDDGYGKSSIFTVARNPGIILIYISSFIACLGALWQFYGERPKDV